MRFAFHFFNFSIFFVISTLVLAKSPVFHPLPEEGSSSEAPTVLPEPPAVPEKASKEPQETITGVVRIVRGSPRTEVFFMDRKGSFIIPLNSRHNEIFEACLLSSRNRTPVTIIVNPQTQVVLSISSANPSNGTSGNSAKTDGTQQKEPSKASPVTEPVTTKGSGASSK